MYVCVCVCVWVCVCVCETERERENYTSAWAGSVIGTSISEQAYVKLSIPFNVQCIRDWAYVN